MPATGMADALAPDLRSEGEQNGDPINKKQSVASILPCWSIEGDLPDTIELRKDPSKGEGLYARRAISVLEPICALPYSQFMAIETAKLETTCYSCLAVTSTHIPHIKGTLQPDIKLKACAGCLKVRFCGKECQATSWPAYHKHECKIFRQYRDNFPPMMVRAVMRVVLLQDKGVLTQEYWNTLMNDLVSHEAFWKALSDDNDIASMARDIKFVTNSSMSLETITRLFWVMRTNSIELPTSVHGGIGTMLDPLFAKFNHSCIANAMLYRPWHTSHSGWNINSQLTLDQRNTFATVIPLRSIEEGEELTISYSDPTMSVQERNAKHERNYFFVCSCSRCGDDTKTAADLERLQPDLSAEYRAWSGGVLQQCELLQGEVGGHLGFDVASEAFDNGIARYLDFPAIYTASDFDQISLHLAYKGLELGAFDEALINLLRPYFLIHPSRIPGRHNYSNLHNMFVIIEVLNILLDIDCKTKGHDVKPADVKQSLRALSTRGFGKESLIYWRQRICEHLSKCLEASAARDLLPLAAQIQERMPLQRSSSFVKERSVMAAVDGTGDVMEDTSAEEAMRTILQLSKARWEVVLQETGY